MREEQEKRLTMEEEKVKKLQEEIALQRKQDEEATEKKKKQDMLIKEVKREEKLRRYCGFLRKQGHVVRNWKTRFFVISEDQLYYFTSNTQTKCKGQISLLGCTAASTDNVESRENCFKLLTSTGKDFILSAATPKEKKKWLDALILVTDELKAKKMNKKDSVLMMTTIPAETNPSSM